jgi:hypothetical protein
LYFNGKFSGTPFQGISVNRIPFQGIYEPFPLQVGYQGTYVGRIQFRVFPFLANPQASDLINVDLLVDGDLFHSPGSEIQYTLTGYYETDISVEALFVLADAGQWTSDFIISVKIRLFKLFPL